MQSGIEKKRAFIINAAYYAIIGAILLGVCKWIVPVMLPFLIAFLAASLIQIAVRRISGENTGKKKLCAILFCAAFYMLLFFVIMAAGSKLLGWLMELVESAPYFYQSRIVPFIEKLSYHMEMTANSAGMEISSQIEKVFQDVVQNMGTYISEFSVKMMSAASAGIKEIPGFFVKVIITIVSTFFIAIDYDKIFDFFKKYLPQDKVDALYRGKKRMGEIAGIYLKSYCFLFFLTFIELAIGFLILRIPYAVLVALAIAVFDILPVLGTGGILLPWAALLLFMQNVPLAVGILILYLVITVVRNVVEPRFVGKRIGLHPLATLIAMFLGLKFTGIIGMIAFPVALAAVSGLKKSEKMQH